MYPLKTLFKHPKNVLSSVGVRISQSNNRNNLSKIQQHRRLFSEYDFQDSGKSFDDTRQPVGTAIIKSALDNVVQNRFGNISRENFNKLSVLDAGCGTGNYFELLSNHGIGEIHGIEWATSLYDRCKQKYSNSIDNTDDTNNAINNDNNININSKITLTYGNPLTYDFNKSDELYDIILANQILHYIDTNETRQNNFLNIRLLLSKFYKLLNKNGCLIINTALPEQINPGLWYHKYIPIASKNMINKFPKKEFFDDELINAGFDNSNNIEIYTILTPYMTFEKYYNFNGIKDINWRYGDNTFELSNENEINNCIENIENDIISTIEGNKNEKIKIIQKFENIRKKNGLSTSIVAYKR